MIHRLRTVLTLLLLAALPLQGYAAAGMLYCGESANSVAVAEHRLESPCFTTSLRTTSTRPPPMPS
jgi:hypothetical protein